MSAIVFVRNMKRFFLLMLVVGISIVHVPACFGDDSYEMEVLINRAINSVKDGFCEGPSDAIFKLHTENKNAIPYLIPKIDSCEEANIILLHNPMISFIHSESLKKNCDGIISAYLIELILGEDELVAINDVDMPFILSDARNYVYGHGLILDEEDVAPTAAGMKEIRRIYGEWWEMNQDKPLEDLRKDWENNMRPLSGSPYHWE